MNFSGNINAAQRLTNNNITYVIIVIKLILAALFSSDYQDKLFLPFVRHFLDNFDNPWQFFYQTQFSVEFPYHPVLLYLLSFFYAPFHYLGLDNVFIGNLFFKIPVLLSDILIFQTLRRTFPGRNKEVLIFYFASPIVIYASYVHSQLDLIPTSVLFLSIYYLTKNRYIKAAFFFGLAISIKLHVLAALPLLIIYLIRKDRDKEILFFIGLAGAIYAFFILPFIQSAGFVHLVLKNPKQKLVFDTALVLSSSKIFLPMLAAMFVYTRFLIYKKINNDLLYTFLAILFSLFVILIPPSPAWYIWLFPFLSIFFIRNYSTNPKIVYIYILLNLFYLVFFLFFYIPDHHDLNLLGRAVDIKFLHEDLNGIFFTALIAVLLACIYAFYNFGVRSNSTYKKENSIIIGVGGDSGSGKSTLLSDLKLLLGSEMTEIEGDGDHKWERNHKNWNDFTHLNPKANFLHKQSEDLLALKQGKDIFRAEYDHTTGSFTKPKLVKSKDYITICGLHPFYLPIMRKIIDLKIFINTDEKLRLHWKIVRDIKKRGYTREQILTQIQKREDDSQKYIAPQKNFADIEINYFADNDYELGNASDHPDMKLKIVMNADIHLEPLINKLFEYNIEVVWDYSEDLHTQYLILSQPLHSDFIKNIAKEIIVNMEELIPQEVTWQEGYRGFVQLVILVTLSERLKAFAIEKNTSNL